MSMRRQEDFEDSFEERSVELSLRKNPATGRWGNKEIVFEKDDSLGWKYVCPGGACDYGFSSLKRAVLAYLGARAGYDPQDKYCRIKRQDYQTYGKPGAQPDELHCSMTVRHYVPAFGLEQPETEFVYQIAM